MRLGRQGAFRGAALAVVAAVALAIAAQAFAGSAPDPRPGDKVLGTKGGITYVSDTEHVTNPASTQALAACPNAGGKSRIIGGGVRIAGIPGNVAITSSRPLDLAGVFGDDDLIIDDYWEASGDAPLDTPITGYAICAKFKGLKYHSFTLPTGGSERQGSDDCGGGRSVTGGGGFIATTGSRVTSMWPSQADEWNVEALDTAGGNGVTTLDFVCMKSRHLRTHVVKRKIPSDQAGFKTAQCAADEHVTGGGAFMNGGPIPSLLDSSFPVDGADKDKVPDDGWSVLGKNESLNAQKLRVYAICLG